MMMKSVSLTKACLTPEFVQLNRWNKQGLEAMLFDDGIDVDDTEVKVRSKGQVTMNDLNELLERKYEALKEKLLMELARQAAGS